MEKKSSNKQSLFIKILIIALCVIVIISIGYNVYQFQRINNLTSRIFALNIKSDGLSDKLKQTEDKTKKYLEIQNEPCATHVNTCLDKILLNVDSFSQAFFQFSPEGSAAAKLGSDPKSFKIVNISVGSINPNTDIGCNGKIKPLFVRYFYTDQGGANGFCTSYQPIKGTNLRLLGFDLEVYDKFPDLELNYSVKNPETAEDKDLKAVRFLPFEGGYFSYAPVGAVNALGRIVFIIPDNQNEFILNYSQGKIQINTLKKQLISF